MFLDALKGSNNWMPKNTCWMGNKCNTFFNVVQFSIPKLIECQFDGSEKDGEEPKRCRVDIAVIRRFLFLFVFLGLLFCGCSPIVRGSGTKASCLTLEKWFSAYSSALSDSSLLCRGLNMPDLDCQKAYTMSNIAQRMGQPEKIYIDTGGVIFDEYHVPTIQWVYPLSKCNGFTSHCLIVYFEMPRKGGIGKMKEMRQQYICGDALEGYLELLHDAKYPYITNRTNGPWADTFPK